MFCIVCGRKAKIGNFCEECFLKREKLFELEDFSLEICDCGSYRSAMKWQEPGNMDEIITEEIEKRIKTRDRIAEKRITYRLSGNRALVKIRCMGFIKPAKKPVEEEKNIAITFHRRKCDNCVKLSGGYSEAIVQIRGNNMEKLIRTIGPQKNATIERTKDGYDMKFIKRSDAKNMIKQLKDVEVKRSFKFIGMKKGKSIIKDFYAIR